MGIFSDAKETVKIVAVSQAFIALPDQNYSQKKNLNEACSYLHNEDLC